MNVVKPLSILDAMLVAPSIAEPSASDPPAWNAGTAYAVGALVHRVSTHRIYRRLVAGTTATAPENDLLPVSPATVANWADHGPTNRWAMFDQEVNTQSSAAGTISCTLVPGVLANSLALLELEADSVQVRVRNGVAGPYVYDRTVSLTTSQVASWYAYFFEPFTRRGLLILTDLPPYLNARVEITLSGAGTVKCGQAVLGTLYELGPTELGVEAGIRDYSRKVTDDTTGVVSLEKRKFAKTLRARYALDLGAANAVHSLLTGLRATPVVWIGDNGAGLEPLVVFGFYRDFRLVVGYPAQGHYTLEIEGMT